MGGRDLGKAGFALSLFAGAIVATLFVLQPG